MIFGFKKPMLHLDALGNPYKLLFSSIKSIIIRGTDYFKRSEDIIVVQKKSYDENITGIIRKSVKGSVQCGNPAGRRITENDGESER
jgi:hypothetical protein